MEGTKKEIERLDKAIKALKIKKSKQNAQFDLEMASLTKKKLDLEEYLKNNKN
jgi:hypothetical protein